MGRKLLVMLLTVLLALAALPGIAAADDDDGDDDDYDYDGDAVYLSLGDSLAMGSYADAAGVTTFPSNHSYTDRLFRLLKWRVDEDFEHAKLGCDGYKTYDMYIDPGDGKCDYATGTQLGDAVMWLQTGRVALVTIDIGANDIFKVQRECIEAGAPDLAACIGFGILGPGGIKDRLIQIMATLRAADPDVPIVGMTYYNPQIAAAIGFYAGAPGPGPLGPVPGPDPLLAGFSDQLVKNFNAVLSGVYTTFGATVADVYSAFKAGDFGDDGGRFQVAGNLVWDNVDAVCVLTSMCPEPGVLANIHPTREGYRVMAWAFWKVVRKLDLDVDDDDD